MDTNTLAQYVNAQVAARASKATLKEELAAVGWSEEDVDAAYAQALIARGVPVPLGTGGGAHGKRASAVEVIVNIFSFILLGIISTALGVLYFQVIGYYFPDPLARTQYGLDLSVYSSAVHYSIAALLIAFPLYVAAVRLWFKRFREDEGKVESRLTKWITYIVLLVASVTIVGDLIAVVYTFLQGEATVRFVLKALTILGIAGAVFSFYYLERKRIQYLVPIERVVFLRFGAALGGIVAVGIVLGFLVAGSPSTERMRTFDAQRASDLYDTASCVRNFAQGFGRLPASLAELNTSTEYAYCADRQDPETGLSYEYRVISPLTASVGTTSVGEFELCGTFALDTTGTTQVQIDKYSYYPEESKWSEHPNGRACYIEKVAVTLPASIVPR